MKRELALLFIIFLTSGCQTNQHKLSDILKLNDTLVYQKVEQGHFQETLYRAQYYSGADVSFDIFELYPGEFSPLTGLALQDRRANNFLFVKYVLEPEQSKLLIEVREGTKVTLSKSFPLRKKLEKISIAWHKREVAVQAGDIVEKLMIPFEVAYIANVTSSMDVAHRLKFQKR